MMHNQLLPTTARCFFASSWRGGSTATRKAASFFLSKRKRRMNDNVVAMVGLQIRAMTTATTAAKRQEGGASFTVQAGGFAWPLASKAWKGGEDAFFVYTDDDDDAQTNLNDDNDDDSMDGNPQHGRRRRQRRRLLVCGVADGVGGSRQPDLYSRTLSEAGRIAATQHAEVCHPQVLLQSAYQTHPMLWNGQIDGSSTACWMTIVATTLIPASDDNDEDQENSSILELHCANLGDSGYMVIRPNNNKNGDDGDDDDGDNGDYTIAAMSQPQTHGPNTPYQLGPGSDVPASAAVTRVSLQRGDVIVVATDGVWDNLFPAHVAMMAMAAAVDDPSSSSSSSMLLQEAKSPLQCASNRVLLPSIHNNAPVPGSKTGGNDPAMVMQAHNLCAHAVAVYQAGAGVTPFDQEHGNLHGQGGGFGKPDDATAIVIRVT